MLLSRLWVPAAIIAAAIIAFFLLSAPHANAPLTPLAAETAASSTPIVTVHDAFRKGVHTLSGSLQAPDPCVIASAAATLTGASTSEEILLDITLPPDTDVCLQEPAAAAFSTTLTAPPGLPLHVRVNGADATTTP